MVKKKAGETLPKPGKVKRYGVVVVMGPANSGKSTFINRVTGADISVVTHKAQTTRKPISGIITRDDFQMVLTDTAGLFSPGQKKLRGEKILIRQAWARAISAERIILILDATQPTESPTLDYILDSLKAFELTVDIVLNKIDLVLKPSLLKKIDVIRQWDASEHIFMISALKKDGLEDVISHLSGYLPEAQQAFPDKAITDKPQDFRASEITRKILLENLHQEIPYRVRVTTDRFEKKNKSLYIDQTIHTTSKAHRQILLKRGLLQTLGAKARIEIEQMTGLRVHLFLHARQSKSMHDRERQTFFADQVMKPFQDTR